MKWTRLAGIALLAICLTLLFASCGAAKFDVIFMIKDKQFAVVQASGGTLSELPGDPSGEYLKEGYAFAGWYPDRETAGQPLDPDALPETVEDGVLTVWAKLVPVSYSITYVTDGGTHQNPASYTIEEPAYFSDAVREGYRFDGWYDGERKLIKTAPGQTGDLTLTAHWTLQTWSVSYADTKGVENSNPETFTVESGDIVLADLTLPGYDFAGWYDGDTRVTSIPAGTAKNMTLTAHWTPVTYTITYHGITETTRNDNPASYGLSDEPIELKTAQRNGYEFLGWFNAENGGEKITKISVGTTGNLELWARWNATGHYTATFIGNGETVYRIFSQDTEKLSEPEVPARIGYTGAWEEYAFPVNEDLVIHAVYTPIVYPITYAGVKGQNPNPATYTIEDAILLSDLTATGYVFDGWYLGEEKVMEISVGTTGEITLTAHWTPVVYTVSYENIKGAENGNRTTYTIEDSFTLAAITADHYVFDGWYLGEKKVTAISAGTTGEITLTARWTPVAYAISYVDTKGAANPNPLTHTVESAAIALAAIEKDGFVFIGWFIGEEQVTEIAAGTTGEITLTAHWTPYSYAITYENTKGATNANPNGYTAGVAVQLAGLTADHYTFDGWYLGEEKVAGISADMAGDLTLTARWIPVSYTIAYEDVRSAVNANPTVYTIESETIVLSGLTTYGYVFEGWYLGEEKITEIPAGTTGEITLTAHWSIGSYTITFAVGGGSPIEPLTLPYGDPLDLDSYIPTAENRIFLGWYRTAIGENDPEYQTTSMPGEDMILYARWKNMTAGEIYYNTKKTAIRADDDYTSPELFGIQCKNADGTDATVVLDDDGIEGVFAPGNVITLYYLVTTNGRTRLLTIPNIRVYGEPVISGPTATDFRPTDAITVALLGLTAQDSFENGLDIQLTVKSGEQVSGGSVVYLATATDRLGNVATKEVTVNFYEIPVITTAAEEFSATASTVLDAAFFGAAATDSFGDTLTVTVAPLIDRIPGTTYNVTISAVDHLGNSAEKTVRVRIYGTPAIQDPTTTDFRVEDEVTVEALGLTAKDSFGNMLDNVSISLNSGTQAAGGQKIYTASVTDPLGNTASKEITVRFYGTPTILEGKEELKVTEDPTVPGAAEQLLNISAKDSFGNSIGVTLTVKSGERVSGGTVIYTATATDHLGNTASKEITVRFFGAPVITTEAEVFPANADTLFDVSFFGAAATDSFGNALTVAVTPLPTELNVGSIIGVRLTATDHLGNTGEKTVSVRIYGSPSISDPTVTAFRVEDDITPEAMGLTASDTFGKSLTVTLTVQGGAAQEAGAVLTLIATVKDELNNSCTREFTVSIYGTPTLTYSCDVLNVTEDPTTTGGAKLHLNASAKDSFGVDLTVTATLRPDTEFAGGKYAIWTLTAVDLLGNTATLDTAAIPIYDADLIRIDYAPGWSTIIKASSVGEEFLASTVDCFGDPCTIRLEAANGNEIAGGNVITVRIVATDANGNEKRSEDIPSIAVYDLPTISYPLDKALYEDSNWKHFFTATDSFGESIPCEVVKDSELIAGNTVTFTVKATDDAGNESTLIVSLPVIARA